ncbi:MAG TPA: GH92 family glycosyl hydrolase [Arachidicoccus sp.]|nr:GH92 family glycosyl hydrolase [Arachidicoccus sp.]
MKWNQQVSSKGRENADKTVGSILIENPVYTQLKARSVSALFIFVLATLLLSSTGFSQSLIKYVDPNIGTAHSRWFFYTPAAVPQGMAKLAPSTNGHYGNASGWEAVGYDPRDKTIEGFVNFHEWQLGGVSIMPATGPLHVYPGDTSKLSSSSKNGYRSHFQHKNETAEPGYYKVLLDDYGITAELTATKRVGFQRFTFPKSDASRIILDIGNVQGESGPVKAASIRMIDSRHFEGYVKTFPKYLRTNDPDGLVCMYFWGELSRAPLSTGSFTSSSINQNSRSADGKGAGLFLNYKTSADEQILVKLGLSYTSTANAAINFKAEATGLSFDAARKQAQDEWERQLSVIHVKGASEDSLSKNRKIKFYTGLYHALLGRGITNDVNGAYPLAGGEIGQLPSVATDGKENSHSGFNFINTDAIWGAYWNLTQLWALSYPHYYRDFIHTQLELSKKRGWFGDGIVNSQYASGVGTNFVGLVIAAGYQCGFRDFDIDKAYAAIRKNELGWENRPVGPGKEDIKSFLDHGYVPYIKQGRSTPAGSNFSASHTLEYSFSAFAAAQLAKVLGKADDYKTFMEYAGGWNKLFDPALKLIRPKDTTGRFIENFNPNEPWRGFQEGNAIQYSYFVPQNPAGLIAAMGKTAFNERLNGIFTSSEKLDFGGGKKIDAFAGVQAQYNQGNQPDMQLSWLFNFSGKPWLTQKWTRAICDQFYGTERIHGYGYGQDEDQGQLGAWLVMNTLGLFDVKGLTDRRPVIEFGSPAFDKVHIQLGNNKNLVIETENNSPNNVYVQSATWNGKPWDKCWIYRDELMQGGTLQFVMGEKPNTNWGVKVPPPSVQ